ncbi:hypothetical protein [Massilia soli]|uniref:Uncharacterized protein n=1 Tax=Massilia soli TaxID=2792854 RepID=A0ABS7SLW4_9BURK|nr:hypothetical protein [Massilia soli]MBZ2207119.1 hypothetical protein [Massilia soli]
MSGWDYSGLLGQVERRFNRDQRDVVQASWSSVVNRFAHVKIHLQDLEQCEANVIKDRSQIDLMHEIFRFNENRIDEITLRASAFGLAAVQALHSVSDIVGTATALSLGTAKWTGYLNDVIKKHQVHQPVLGPLIEELQSHKDYVYLADIVNQSKHQNVVNAKFALDMTGTHPNRYEFLSFVRHSKAGKSEHQSREIKSFLAQEAGRQAGIVIRIGQALETLL